jgi:hypothetical protein
MTNKSTPSLGYEDRRNRVRYRHVMCEKPVKRKPRIRTLIKDAEKNGKKVSGATVAADGSVTLQFGEQTNTEPNPWERAMQGPKQ